jgi:predicted Ser/Thr protein kinase
MWNWISLLVGRSRERLSQGQAHLTFGQTSIGRSMIRTGLLLKRQLWIWPIIAFVVLATIGYFIKSSIQRTMEANLTSQLVTLRDIERAMLEKWFAVQEANATSIASTPEVRDLVAELQTALKPLPEGEAPPAGQRPLSVIRADLTTELDPQLQALQFAGYAIFDRDQTIIASNEEGLLGHKQQNYEEFLAKVFEGEPRVSVPFSSFILLKDHLGRMRAGQPTMFACVPIRDSNFRVIALLGLRIRPEREFTEIIQHGKFGATGETYAIDKNGTMVSNSRFDEKLIELGLIPDNDDSASILNVQMRDPGGNLEQGFRPKKRRAELPLTSSAASAIAGNTSYSLAGNRDYRGVPAVAAWTWLPKYEMGLVTKIDYDEAFRPLTILQRVFFSLFALLIIAAIAIFIFTLIVSRLQREAQKSAIQARQLGQYRLEEQIGAGGMGVVYRGHHAMLRRPTAVKMLEPERVSEASIARFEREVQITCQLNNPHTVAIYDYGRTPEGVFYYAMEFLDGINLESLVEKYGAQPDGRVISILKQVCASLFEAHSLGLVHRDIKPANIMLNRRGAEPDVVKVLDFGLVKSLNERSSDPSSRALSGTPLYMSPEAIQSPDLIDARSDIYAVGAVGYFLLTGSTVFNARTLNDLCQQHIDAVPELPSHKLGKPVPPELEHALLACLEKNRAKRPQTARDLAILLDQITPLQPWTRDAAEAWWSRHERGEMQKTGGASQPASTPGGTVVSGFDRTMDGTHSS